MAGLVARSAILAVAERMKDGSVATYASHGADHTPPFKAWLMFDREHQDLCLGGGADRTIRWACEGTQ